RARPPRPLPIAIRSSHSTQMGTALSPFTLSAGTTDSTMISSRSRASSGLRSSLLLSFSERTSSLKYRVNPRRLSFLYPGGASRFLGALGAWAASGTTDRATTRVAKRQLMGGFRGVVDDRRRARGAGVRLGRTVKPASPPDGPIGRGRVEF